MRMTKQKSIEKAARKLAYVHQAIDLYNDRPELHSENYWMEYLTDSKWDDPDIGWRMSNGRTDN